MVIIRRFIHNLSGQAALFQNLVEEKLNRERTGHRSNAIFKYEKPSLEQQRIVGDILGPPAGLHVNKMPSEDVRELDLLDDFECDIPDDILCNIPIPGDRLMSMGGDSNTVSETYTSCVFNNCRFNLANK